jgi:hypothetical protein
MVYGQPAPRAAIPAAADLLEAIADSVRSVLREELAGERPQSTIEIPAKVLRERRRYWLQRAAERLKLGTQGDRLRILGWPTTLRARLSAIENGSAALRDDEIRDFARAYRIPERILTEPPATDAERLDEWQELALIEMPQTTAERPRERRRQAS